MSELILPNQGIAQPMPFPLDPSQVQFIEMPADLFNPTVEIKVKYLEGAHELEQNDKGNWIDMYTYESVIIPPHTSTLINLGVSMELPEGFEGWLVPRSSTFRKYHLIQTNHIGIIDNSYCGNNDIWMMAVYNLSDDAVTINKDTRLCQFRIVPVQPPIKFTTVDNLKNPDRNGFGSTGD